MYPSTFKSPTTHQVIQYVRANYGDELEFLWADTPDCAIWRNSRNRKWYAIIMTINQQKLGRDEPGLIEIINTSQDPDLIADLIDHQKFFPAYHMNKTHWLTIPLDGTVDAKTICNFIDSSYQLIDKKR